MDIGKKGVVFTGSAIIITTILLTVFYVNEGAPVDAFTDTSVLQLKNTNRIYDTLQRVIESQGRRAVHDSITTRAAATNHTGNLYVNGPYSSDGVTNTKAILAKCLTHGHFTAINRTVIKCQSIEDELGSFVDFIKNSTNTDISFEIQNVKIEEVSPYILRVTGEAATTARDAASTSSQNVAFRIDTSIENVPSPTYIHTNSSVEPHPYEPLIDFVPSISSWGNGTTNDVTVDNEFFEYTRGPSLLQRLGGNYTMSNCCGIASIVNPQEVSNPNNYSHLDYHFFAQDCGTNTRRLDFSGLSDDMRASYGGFHSLNDGLQGAILPLSFIEQTGLNESGATMTPVTCS